MENNIGEVQGNMKIMNKDMDEIKKNIKKIMEKIGIPE